MAETLLLDGESLTAEQLHRAAGSTGLELEFAADALARLRHARAVVERALQRGDPVYGLNTGLGARVGETLPRQALADFSYRTLRGRAHAGGAPLPAGQVRAAMIVRLNTLLRGAAGASPAVADHLRACLGEGLTPVIGETASIGAGDLCWGATMGLALIGEGGMQDAAGHHKPATEALAEAGLEPLRLAPRDGLALANHASFSGALAALGVAEAAQLVAAVQISTALAMEGFRANLSPLDPAILAARPQPGQARAAGQLAGLLAGGALNRPGAARRLQDPLSLRNAVQVQGAVLATLDFARSAAEAEINGASDNPIVVLKSDEIRSAGAYHTPLLTVVMEALSRALAQMAVSQLARCAKLLSARYTDLPLFLARPGPNSNGFAPVMKVAEALTAEILHQSQPVPLWPSVNADGTEDLLTNAPLAAKALLALLRRGRCLTAIELLISAQAVELRGLGDDLAPSLTTVLKRLRSVVAPLDEDRPMGAEIERLAAMIAEGQFTLPGERL